LPIWDKPLHTSLFRSTCARLGTAPPPALCPAASAARGRGAATRRAALSGQRGYSRSAYGLTFAGFRGGGVTAFGGATRGAAAAEARGGGVSDADGAADADSAGDGEATGVTTGGGEGDDDDAGSGAADRALTGEGLAA